MLPVCYISICSDEVNLTQIHMVFKRDSINYCKLKDKKLTNKYNYSYTFS